MLQLVRFSVYTSLPPLQVTYFFHALRKSVFALIDKHLIRKSETQYPPVPITSSLLSVNQCFVVHYFSDISSVESKSPRKHLGVFNAQPSRYVRSQGDQACSRGSSVTWDPG